MDAVLCANRRRGTVSTGTALASATAALLLAAVLAPWQVIAQSRSTEDGPALVTALTGQAFADIVIRSGGPRGSSAASFDTATGRFVAHDATLRWLVSQAYAAEGFEPAPFEAHPLHQEFVTGGPDWLDRDTFIVEARADLPVTAGDLRAMLRQLLHDHFDLFVRVERHESPGYRLVRARSDSGAATGLQPSAAGCADRVDGAGGGPGHLVRRCTTLGAFAADVTLAEVLARPVVDRTGLRGKFDVSLSYQPTPDELATIYETTLEALPREFLTRPTIATAFEQQLGLRLEPTRVVTETLAIDFAARPAQVPVIRTRRF